MTRRFSTVVGNPRSRRSRRPTLIIATAPLGSSRRLADRTWNVGGDFDDREGRPHRSTSTRSPRLIPGRSRSSPRRGRARSTSTAWYRFVGTVAPPLEPGLHGSGQRRPGRDVRVRACSRRFDGAPQRPPLGSVYERASLLESVRCAARRGGPLQHSGRGSCGVAQDAFQRRVIPVLARRTPRATGMATPLDVGMIRSGLTPERGNNDLPAPVPYPGATAE